MKTLARPKARERITDEDILDMLIDGTLEVDIQTTVVKCRGRVLKPTLMGRDGDNGTRYRVEIRSSGRKRTIALAKLVYMAGNLQLIPDGFCVHHHDEDRYNDAFHNLVLLTDEDHKKVHSKFHYEKRRARALADVPF